MVDKPTVGERTGLEDAPTASPAAPLAVVPNADRLGDETDRMAPIETEQLHPLRKVKLAERTLIGLGVVTAFLVICYMVNPEKGAPLLEFIKLGVIPMATFVLGYYFSRPK